MSLLVQSNQRISAIDYLRSTDSSATTQIASVLGFAILTALAAQVRIYLFDIPVPFSLQTLVVYGSGLFLGTRNGTLSQVVYLALGLFFPVFAGDGFGLTYMMSVASAGYLLSFPLVAAVVGFCSHRWNSIAGNLVSLLCGSAVLFTFGVVWLHFMLDHASWSQSIYQGWLVFLPYDIVKWVVVSGIYGGVRRFT